MVYFQRIFHYNFNRYYNPNIGRYLQADPIGLDGGQNVYNYVNNNPLNGIDPRGLALNLVPGAIGAVVGGGVSVLVESLTERKPNYKQAFINGAISGGVSGLTLGLASGPIATALGGKVIGGAISSAVGASVNLALQGYRIASGQQSCTLYEEEELLFSAALPAGMGSVLMRPGTATMQSVTAWGPKTPLQILGQGVG